jgi:hypothetical protein
VHSILVRGATLSTALPLALDALKLVWPREVDAYRASVKGSNYHHTAKRCLMENAWRIMDHGAFVEALRMDFTEADVFVDKESWLPHPFTCHRPEASMLGGAVDWAEVPEDVKAKADPGGFLKGLSDSYQTEIRDRIHTIAA